MTELIHPTPLAWLALLAWPLVTMLLFLRLPPVAAAAGAILGGELLLPELVSFDVVGFPPIDRTSVACVSALAAALVFDRRALRSVLPGTGIEALAVVLVAGAFLTALANPDPVAVGGFVLPGMGLYDGLSAATEIVLTIWIPFFLGRALYRRSADVWMLLGVLAFALLAYSPLVLIELRLSPQLHRWVYGFHQHQFLQTFRGGGWRPMVFMAHGLTLAQFVLFGAAAAVGLWRARRSALGLPSAPIAVYLAGLLLALKSLGAVVYGALLLPCLALLRPRWQLRVASALAVLVLAYPLARGLDVFPTRALLSAAAQVSAEREQSLAFRFENEKLLLDHARERLALGWGTFGRHRVRDPQTGQDLSVTDGYWIISLGTSGVLGLVATFGLLLGPVWLATAARRTLRTEEDRLAIGILAWLVAISGANLLPNADFTPFILVMAGALAGVTEAARAARRAGEREERVLRRAEKAQAPAPPADAEAKSAASVRAS
jgi:hypothetical protein